MKHIKMTPRTIKASSISSTSPGPQVRGPPGPPELAPPPEIIMKGKKRKKRKEIQW